jgi:hypothetical protein
MARSQCDTPLVARLLEKVADREVNYTALPLWQAERPEIVKNRKCSMKFPRNETHSFHLENIPQNVGPKLTLFCMVLWVVFHCFNNPKVG